MCSEGQVARLYKYNGLSPRMFHTAWHFHYLKLRRGPALPCRPPQIYPQILHVIGCRTCTLDNSTAANDILTHPRTRTHTHRHTRVQGMFMNGRNESLLPAGCSGLSYDRLRYRFQGTLNAAANTNTRRRCSILKRGGHRVSKPGIIHKTSAFPVNQHPWQLFSLFYHYCY